MSEEFERRHHDLAPQSGVLLRDIQLCELANPAKWDNEEWLDILRSLGPVRRQAVDAPQAVRVHAAAVRLPAARRACAKTSSVISVGAGHELVLYWLANHVRRVIATDMYEGVWQDVQGREGDPDVINRPDDYAPFPVPPRSSDLHEDGRPAARLPGRAPSTSPTRSPRSSTSAACAGAAATIREMGRVLKPGGILALATEYVLGGPPHRRNFLPEEIRGPGRSAGLELVQPIDEAVYRRYSYTAVDLYRIPTRRPTWSCASTTPSSRPSWCFCDAVADRVVPI